MMTIDQLMIFPKTIALSTTYQCSAACKNCCFACNPTIKKRLSLQEMKDYIDQSMKYYGDSLEVLVLTGGECFLLVDDLVEIVEYGASKGLIVRIVTNGYWAKTYHNAYDMLSNLRNKGLKEINYSTGDDHQKWVDCENIVNGCMAAMDLGLTCFVNVEMHDNCSFNGELLLNDSRLVDYFDVTKYEMPLKIERGMWIPFDESSNISYEKIEVKEDLHKKRCRSLFTTLPITPYSQLMACCGLTCEYIVPFRLGNLHCKTIKELYEMQFHDLLKIWLFVESPYSVLQYIYNKRGIDKKITGHLCHVCAEIFKDEGNIKYINDNYNQIMPSVMFKYILLKPTL
jgi:hypothetical protein